MNEPAAIAEEQKDEIIRCLSSENVGLRAEISLLTAQLANQGEYIATRYEQARGACESMRKLADAYQLQLDGPTKD